MNEQKAFQSGFAAIVGAPNAGKSTLLNQFVLQKVSITSRKPQTTRDRILGIVNQPAAQIVFVDTPGIFRTQSPFNKKIVEAAFAAVRDVDIILLLIDVAARKRESEDLILKSLATEKKNVILVLNKIDRMDKKMLLPVIESFQERFRFHSVVPVSAKKGIQTDELLQEIVVLLPQGPPLFDTDTVTNVSEKFMVRELVREKVFRLTGMEIPYSTAVTVDAYYEKKKRVEIYATIHVSKKSHKGIILGKSGSKIREIREKARFDIEKMTESKVFLKLFVRVTKNWTKKEKILKELGY